MSCRARRKCAGKPVGGAPSVSYNELCATCKVAKFNKRCRSMRCRGEIWPRDVLWKWGGENVGGDA
eukprot:6184607-Pleurochrysis_carterae.AAC.4